MYTCGDNTFISIEALRQQSVVSGKTIYFSFNGMTIQVYFVGMKSHPNWSSARWAEILPSQAAG